MTRADAPPLARQSLVEVTGFGTDLVAEPNMEVDYTVFHGASDQGNLREWLRFDRSSSRMAKALYCSGWGASFLVGTRPRSNDDLESRTGAREFSGSLKPNPTFIYDATSEFEAIIAIDPDAVSPQHSHSLAVKEAVKKVGELAWHSKAALMSVQSPVQLPTRQVTGSEVTDRTETPARSNSIAVRFSVALRERSSSARVALANAYLEYCRSRGFGLWIADTRVDRRSGDWYAVRESRPRQAAKYRDEKLRGVGDKAVRLLAPVTIVGPARIGAVYSILALLDEYPEIGIAGCGVTSFDYLVFINLLITVRSSSSAELNTVRGFGDGAAPAAVFARMASEVVTKAYPGDDKPRQAFVASLTWDYRTHIGDFVEYPAVIPRKPGPATTCKTSDERVAIWFGWEGYGAADSLTGASRTLCAALEPAGVFGWMVEYLVCREVSSGHVRGKGKLSFPESPASGLSEDAGSRMSALCTAIEERWASRASIGRVAGVEEVCVSWRESWLGHWTK